MKASELLTFAALGAGAYLLFSRINKEKDSSFTEGAGAGVFAQEIGLIEKKQQVKPLNTPSSSAAIKASGKITPDVFPTFEKKTMPSHTTKAAEKTLLTSASQSSNYGTAYTISVYNAAQGVVGVPNERGGFTYRL